MWLWSRAQCACLHVLHGHSDVVTSVALLGATLATGSLDDTVKVWDLQPAHGGGAQPA